MRGRLTLEKVNAAIKDMVSYAEANSQLIVAPKKKVKAQFLFDCKLHLLQFTFVLTIFSLSFLKLAENLWEKALVSEIFHFIFITFTRNYFPLVIHF